ncbi:hypothetical protein CISIN_1g0039661mg, partial [Citrus sinensis]
MFGATTLIVK